MSTELATTENIVDETTGEVYDLDSVEQMTLIARDKPELIAAYIRRLDDAKRNVESLRAELGAYLVDRMDSDATQTLHAGGMTITVSGGSDEVVEYDGDALRSALLGLVAEGVLSQAAVEKAIRVKVEASKSGVNSLRALRDERVDAAIGHAESTRNRPRRVTIK